MKRLVRALAVVIGFAGLIAILLGWNAISRATADIHEPDAAVWLHTPHVSPGGTIDAELKIYGGKRIGIRQLAVYGGANPIALEGRGQYWKDTISSSTGFVDSESIEFEIEVPPDAAPGTTLELDFEVSYVKARRLDAKTVGGRFDNEERSAQLTLSVPVLSPARRLAAQLLSLARALLAFALFTGLYMLVFWLRSRSAPTPAAKDPEADGDDGNGLEMFVFLILAVLGIAGYMLFAQPSMAALSTSSTVIVVLAMIVWVFGPPLSAVVIRLRRSPVAAGPPEIIDVDVIRTRKR